MKHLPKLAAFEGDWRFSRKINHADGLQATVTGNARFVPDGSGLRYDEEGAMQLAGGAPLTARRSYLWRPGLEVLFDDGYARRSKRTR